MANYAKRVLSWVLALTLLTTCAISGLVLPASADGENLLVNGDLEQGASVAWGNSEYVMDGVGKDGAKGIKIETTVEAGGASVYPGPYYKGEFNAALEPNTTYVFSFDYKTEGVGIATIDVVRAGTDWTGWGDTNLPAAADWTTYSIEFTTGAAENMNANTGWEWKPIHLHYAEAVGTGVAYYDNFKLVKKVPDANLVPNGDFEQGASVTWGNSTSVVAGAGVDGSWGVEHTTAGSIYAKFGTALALENGATYKLSFQVKGVSASGVSYVGFYRNTGLTFGEGFQSATSGRIYLRPAASTDEWAIYTGTFTAGENASIDASWGLLMNRNASESNTLYFDNISIEKIGSSTVTATAIALDKTAATLEVGDELTLAVSATPDGAELPTVAWTTSDANVATVEGGKVTAVAAGTATITATAEGLTPVTCTVTVSAAVSDNNLLTNGDFEDGTTGWGTADSSVIAEGNGKDGSWGLKIATEVLEGEAAENPGPYYKGEFNAALKPNTTYIFSYDYKHEGKGWGQLNVVRTGTDWTGWTNSANLTATEWTTVTVEFTTGAAENMNANTSWEWKPRHVHYANAANYGTGTVWFDNFKLVEKVVVEATAITLNKDAITLEVGDDFTFTTTVAPENAEQPEIAWTTSNASVATVEGGKVTAVAAGTATITATAGTLTDTCTVTVVEDDGNLLKNGDLELGASVAWGNSEYVVEGAGKDGGVGIKFETTVSEGEAAKTPGVYYKGAFNGILKPNTTYIFSFDYKHEGKGWGQLDVVYGGTDWSGWADTTLVSNVDWTTKTFEFTTGAAENMNVKEGFEWQARMVHYANAANYGSATVWFDNFKLVEKVVVPATAIKLDKSAATLKPEQTTTLVVTAEPENAEPPVITWSTSNAAVATVADGVVTAVAEGTATITATFGELTATCAITVVPDDGNIIVNGGFTNGTDAWGRNETQKGYIVSDAGKDGAGIKLTTDITAESTAHQTPGVYYLDEIIAAMEPDTVYTFSFDYKHEGMGFGQIVFNIAPGKLENGAELKTVALSTGDKDWTTMTYVITTPSVMPESNTGWEWQMRQVQYYDKGVGTGTSYFDNFKLVETAKVVHAESLGFVSETIEVLPYDSATLAVTTTPAGASTGILTWESSDPETVSVDQTGKVTALKGEGEATVTITNDKGKTAAVKVVITEYANLFKNGDFELGATSWDPAATIKPGVGKGGGYGIELSHEGDSGWTSRYYKGSFVGLMEPATTYIFSVDYYAPYDTSLFRIWSADMGLSATTGDFETGTDEWKTYTKIFTTPTDLELRTGWDFSFVCEATGGAPAVLDNVSIKKYTSGVDAESITLSLDKLTLIPGRTGALTAHALPVEADLNDMTWTSSDENVATVEYGVVTGIGKGTAIITGTTKNGKSATCTVTVSGNEVLVLNGSFDTDDDVWTLAGGAAVAGGEGRVNSNALSLANGASASQTFTGLEAETPYQLTLRYRSSDGKAVATVKLANGAAVLVEEITEAGSLWTTVTYEFTTGASVEETTVLTLSSDSTAPIYIDNIVLSVKASLIDFVIGDIVWDGGGHQVTPGTKLSFAVTVINQGEDPVAKDSVIVVDLCKNGQTFQTLEYVCDAPLATNESVIIMAETPWAAEKGDWVVSARANPTLSILELDDANNTDQVNLRVNETILEAPKEAQAMDMTELTFSDEFDSYDSIDMYATGRDGYKWYVTRSWGAGTVQPDSYTVKDGTISLHDVNPVFNITLSTVDSVSGVGWDYHFGYLETRLRIVYPERHEYQEGMSGGIPAIWSFPTDKWLETPGKNHQWVEMDWLEYWGLDTEKWPQYPDGYYTVTLHDQVQGQEGVEDHWYSNSNAYRNGLGDGEWHVMGWLWAYNGVIAYIDGEEAFRITYSEDGVPSCRVTDHTGFSEEYLGAFSYMNAQEMCLYIAGAYDKPLELDYVRIWQGGNAQIDAPSTDDDEPTGDEEIIIDMTAEEFWHNYCTDDWGDPIKTIDKDNVAYVLEGGTYWPLLSDERRAEINALLAENGQPTFEELLAAAEAFANGDGGDGEAIPGTGATTALPPAMAAVMLVSAAGLWISRKRKATK